MTSKHKIYFSGDSGYCDVFKTIGNFYGPFDLAVITIGEPLLQTMYTCILGYMLDPVSSYRIHPV